jgi:hypothetical protein
VQRLAHAASRRRDRRNIANGKRDAIAVATTTRRFHHVGRHLACSLPPAAEMMAGTREIGMLDRMTRTREASVEDVIVGAVTGLAGGLVGSLVMNQVPYALQALQRAGRYLAVRRRPPGGRR